VSVAVDAAFEEIRYSAPDGLRLYARVYAADRARERLPVVCLPGLTRNARDFHDLALALSAGEAGRMVAAFDYRGRGRSAYDRDWRHYDLLVETSDIEAGLTALDIGHACFIGTSRGGLILHLLSASRPAALKAAILNDVGPVVEGEGLAQIRTYLEKTPKPHSWREAAEIQRLAHGGAFPALGEDDWERMARAIFRENESGRIVTDYDPALLKAIRAVDLSRPLPDAWQQFMGLTAIPLMVIRGEHSRLLAPETVAKMADLHPGLEVDTVAGQGHAPLLETGDLPARIAAFIAAADARA
jgi:pimeloyl-ACP methyl ester carboxylesterase